MYTFKIKLFQTQRTTQFLPKSVLKLLRDCKSKIVCLKDDRGICFCTRTPQVDVIMHLSMLSPRGGGVGQGVGILTFSIKKSQIPHPRDKIIGQNPDPGQVKVVKCHSNLVAHKRSVIIKLRQNQ